MVGLLVEVSGLGWCFQVGEWVTDTQMCVWVAGEARPCSAWRASGPADGRGCVQRAHSELIYQKNGVPLLSPHCNQSLLQVGIQYFFSFVFSEPSA